MLGNNLKYIVNDSGCYIYLETPERDILLTKKPIEDPKKYKPITKYIDQAEHHLDAHKSYRTLLNDLLDVYGVSRLGWDITKFIRRTLDKYDDKRS